MNKNCGFINADQARQLSRNLTLIYGEICAIQQAILAAIDNHEMGAVVTDNTEMTTSPDYYDLLSGQSDDRKLQDELDQVQAHFVRLGYNIRPLVNPTTASTLMWQIFW